MLPNTRMDALFAATVQATEEAILNAMAKLQDASGAWVFSYLTDGENASDGVDMRIGEGERAI